MAGWHNGPMVDRVRGYAHRVDIAGDVQAVWRAFTEDALLARWCAPDAQIGARPGGLFRASVEAGGHEVRPYAQQLPLELR